MQHLSELLVNQEIKHYYALADETQDNHAEHGLNHVLRVMNTCKILASKLNLTRVDTENICIAALLHDVGVSQFGKAGHTERSYQIAKNYTKNEEILNAIRYHSNGYNSDYGYILTLADKLDICHERVTELGRTIFGVRQFIHLISMDLNIANGLLAIFFTSDKQLDLKELNEYYFTKKIFNAIKNFTNHFKLKYQVYIDEYQWF